MSKKGRMIIGVYILILLLAGWFIFGQKLQPKKEIHYHAGFVVFQDNKKLDFSDNKYMNIKPCTNEKEGEEIKEDEQLEKAHLHDNIGDVVHIEADNARWEDLFTNLKYPINYSQTKAYIDGQEIKNFNTRNIQSYDSIVIFIGENDPKFIKEAVTKEHILETEKKSDDCGD